MANHELASPSHSITFSPAQDKQHKDFKSLESPKPRWIEIIFTQAKYRQS